MHRRWRPRCGAAIAGGGPGARHGPGAHRMPRGPCAGAVAGTWLYPHLAATGLNATVLTRVRAGVVARGCCLRAAHCLRSFGDSPTDDGRPSAGTAAPRSEQGQAGICVRCKIPVSHHRWLRDPGRSINPGLAAGFANARNRNKRRAIHTGQRNKCRPSAGSLACSRTPQPSE